VIELHAARIERACFFVKPLVYTALVVIAQKDTDVRKTKGERTRDAILTTAANLATQEGLDPLSIGRLAEETGMSKSGLFAHFGSKEELQIATVEHAASVFVDNVIAPARQAPKGLARVWALCDHKLAYLEREVFPGGCFFASTSVEFSHKPGPVRDRIEDMLRSWLSYLEHAVEQAQEAGELDDELSAREITFELDSFGMAANWQYRMFGEVSVYDGARRATRQRLEALRPAA
jgi:AcrR family transcriptional regulator